MDGILDSRCLMLPIAASHRTELVGTFKPFILKSHLVSKCLKFIPCISTRLRLSRGKCHIFSYEHYVSCLFHTPTHPVVLPSWRKRIFVKKCLSWSFPNAASRTSPHAGTFYTRRQVSPSVACPNCIIKRNGRIFLDGRKTQGNLPIAINFLKWCLGMRAFFDKQNCATTN